jgi:hypothetical protein
MKPPIPLDKEDQAAFEAWTEKFWMFIEDKGDALQIWQAATTQTATRCAVLAERSDLEGDAGAGEAIRRAYKLD